MASATSFPDTMTSLSPSSLMDMPLNDEDFLLGTVMTDSPDFLSGNTSLSVSGTNMSSYTGPVRDALYIVIPITILYSLIFFTGVIGNVVTCIVISRNKHMHTATNYYLFSLAVSDLLLLVTGLPQEMYSIWSRYPYVFGEVFCVLRGLAAETSVNATVLTITAFTVERYVAICHPFLSHTMSKLSRAVKLILVIWIVALAFAIPQAIQFGIVRGRRPEEVMCLVKTIIFEHSFEISTFLFFVTPMTLITVLYALIGLRLRRSNMMKKDAGSFSCKHSCSPLTTTSLQQQPSQRHLDGRKCNCCRRQQSQSSRRVLKMLVAVVVAFFICWAPFHAQRLVAIYGNQRQKPEMLKIYEIVTYISGILYYVSTTINPILYHTMSLKFREAFKDTLTRCCGFRGIKGHRARRSYSILSRSAQRGAMGASNAGQESTDYSGNSMREEVLPSGPGSGGSCRSSLKEPSGTRRSFRKQDSGYMIGGHTNEGKPAATNSVNSQGTGNVENVIQTNNYRRSYCRTENNESNVKTTMVHKLNQQNIRDSQRSLFNNKCTKKGKQKCKAESVWKVFHCVKSSTNSVKEDKSHSISYSPSDPGQGRQVPAEVFSMMSVCRANSIRSLASCSNNISNSSLRDVERGALEDELTAYMEELRRREMC